MVEALYGIKFISNLDNVGYGMVVLETERILGEDSSFIFIGNYEMKNNKLLATVKCKNDRKILTSVFFGDIDEYTLKLEGTPAHDNFILHGTMIENTSFKVDVELSRRAELPFCANVLLSGRAKSRAPLSKTLAQKGARLSAQYQPLGKRKCL